MQDTGTDREHEVDVANSTLGAPRFFADLDLVSVVRNPSGPFVANRCPGINRGNRPGRLTLTDQNPDLVSQNAFRGTLADFLGLINLVMAGRYYFRIGDIPFRTVESAAKVITGIMRVGARMNCSCTPTPQDTVTSDEPM